VRLETIVVRLLAALTLVWLGIVAPAWAQTTGLSGGTIASIEVRGNQRIEPATVRSYMTVAMGDPDSTR